MADQSRVDADRGNNESLRGSPVRRATAWVVLDGGGDQRLSTVARLSVVLIVCLAGWLTDSATPSFSPRPGVEASTLLWLAVGAAMIVLVRAVRGPEVHGRFRLGWDGVVLALATAWTLVALATALRAHGG